MTKLYTREMKIETLEEADVNKIWSDLLPLFIIVAILIVAGILILCEKIREQLYEKDDAVASTTVDAPPQYDDLSLSNGAITDVSTPPPPYRNIEPPSYEFINRAFSLDDQVPPPPPSYIVATHTSFVN